ncbi:type I-E CRISPR-associated protein Cas7/Cse4/CasC [Nocardia sp. NBC_01503]|uniref:type I-E CRISPR-associated protein Cas7/Cse4/CasC n=1 Tax=Nocardia sp. NBC_01503 TaxID=2975997 RepID=UPI002E7BA22A|nr:type I-E CRISPR-associated protein Cas7/Cse4/CasC [Nocardia sp. NBC_01503]WTL32737.1 type I-E CRISPR-associated protein Cas7/Cse4/CasC [Nocardia sp. NBC_01503]
MDDQYLSLHAIVTFSGVLLNRDENNLPKELVYGGVTRTRVSAQSWRRAERMYMRTQANNGFGPLAGHAFGIRTREWAIETADTLVKLGWSQDKADSIARLALEHCKLKFGDPDKDPMKTKVAIFAPADAGKKMAAILHSPPVDLDGWFEAETQRLHYEAEKRATEQAAKKARKGKSAAPAESESDSDKPALTPLPKKVRDALVAALAPADAIDIALFGRMLAEITAATNVDGAIQSMHAFTVDSAEVDDDFFTAVDDRKEDRRSAFDAIEGWSGDDSGAAMTGYQSLTSGTFYRNAVLDRAQLRRNLMSAGIGPDHVVELADAAELAYVEAFCHAVPSAKKNNTGALGTLPKFVLAVCGSRPVNFASAFEQPLAANGLPVSVQATQHLLRQHKFVFTRLPGITAGRALTYDADIADRIFGADSQSLVTPVDKPEHLPHRSEP